MTSVVGLGGPRGGTWVALWALVLPLAAFAAGPDPAIGERAFRDGVGADGAPLRGHRDSGSSLLGAAAACAGCHRRSGLGGREGALVVPPIVDRYLLRARALRDRDRLEDDPAGAAEREPYDDASLAAAIRTGVTPGGHRLGILMPRYPLDDATMASLLAYLHQLGATSPPGVSETALDFATVIPEDADPAVAAAMLQVLERFFATQNRVLAPEVRPMKARKQIMYRVTRSWRLHVWRLAGPSASHAAQLEALYAREPVYALLSGLPGSSWAQVHDFCERRHVPCLFPNVDAPLADGANDYSLYFSRGVLLEADLVARALAPPDAAGRGRRLQVFRAGSAGERAANALAAALRARHVEIESLPVDDEGWTRRPEFARLGADDDLVLWLDAADLRRLPADVAAGRVYLSGLLGGLERAPLPPAWRARSLMAYPFDPPALRGVRMNYPLTWFRAERIPVVDEHVQADTFIACQILAETLRHMLDNFDRDFLIERIESMIGLRLVTGYYPRLTLGPGQRFASRGGYLVRFDAGGGVEPVGDWVVP